MPEDLNHRVLKKNPTMKIQAKELIFKQHSINCVTNIQKSQILVEDVWRDTVNKRDGSNWVDASDWSKEQIRDFLGY